MLFTFAGGAGHFLPLLPLAQAAVSAGHQVVFGGQAALLPMVEQAGFRGFDTGGASLRDESLRAPLLALDPAREDRAVRAGYAGRIARQRAAAIIALADNWQPDLLVRDEMDFGAAVAAERLGIPHACVVVIAAGSLARPELIAEPLHALRAEHGLPPDPDLAMLSRYLVLSPFPPSFRDPGFPLPPTARSLRPPAAEGAGALPACLAGLPPRPLVYVTLGTIFNVESGDLFRRVLAGLAPLPINLIVTVGPQIDPAELGPQPAHIRIERFIDQAALLPHCALVVAHAGSGTLIGALAQGLPLVLLPIGADQPLNAARAAALGLAQVLDPVTATPAALADAVAAGLADPRWRHAAQRLRCEIAALPDPDQAVTLLERLVRS
jgi:UDP:flavonoid glycosyltransferase YjiC (YdhE family)